MKRQLALILARAQIPIEWLRPPSADDDEAAEFQDELPDDLLECLSNTRLSSHFKAFGKELGVEEPKSLEDVYKSHLENTSMRAVVLLVPLADRAAWQDRARRRMWTLREPISRVLSLTRS
jgi:26S proteasome regulatory subunit N1